MDEVNIESLVVCTVLADNINIELNKIEFDEGDTVIVRAPQTFTDEDYHNLLEVINSMRTNNRQFLLLSKDFDIEKLTLKQLTNYQHEINLLIERRKNAN